jgi:hypothetical protein
MPKTYTLACGDNCSFGPETKWGLRVSDAMVEGKTYRAIQEMAKAEGDTIWPGTISRHKKHILITGRGEMIANAPPPISEKPNNIAILEEIIARGFDNRKNWKPTISDTMKAMDMWFRLTQGNPFDDLLNTLAAASLGETEAAESNPQAVHAVGEQVAMMFTEEEAEEVLAT